MVWQGSVCTSYIAPFLFYLCPYMFIIAFTFPNACMIGFEFFEENEEMQFNEMNFYLLFLAVSYRWRNNGDKIQNLDL